MNHQELIEKTELKVGNHKSIDQGSCIMELVSYLANEPWSDHPKCACPVLTSYAIKYNDRVPNKERQKLKALIPKLLNSRNTSKQKDRYELLVIRSFTVIFSIFLEALKMPDEAEKLRSFKVGQWIEIKDYINLIKLNVRKNADAAAAAYAVTADKKNIWLNIRDKIYAEMYKSLEMACDV